MYFTSFLHISVASLDCLSIPKASGQNLFQWPLQWCKWSMEQLSRAWSSIGLKGGALPGTTELGKLRCQTDNILIWEISEQITQTERISSHFRTLSRKFSKINTFHLTRYSFLMHQNHIDGSVLRDACNKEISRDSRRI